MIYLKAKIQDLLDDFENEVNRFAGYPNGDTTDYLKVKEARQAILTYWERGEA